MRIAFGFAALNQCHIRSSRLGPRGGFSLGLSSFSLSFSVSLFHSLTHSRIRTHARLCVEDARCNALTHSLTQTLPVNCTHSARALAYESWKRSGSPSRRWSTMGERQQGQGSPDLAPQREKQLSRPLTRAGMQ